MNRLDFDEKLNTLGGRKPYPNGRFFLAADHFAALAEKEEDWQLKYDLLTQDYEQKWGLSNRLQEQIALLNPCGHSPAESIVCNICGYPDPRKIIASLTENFEAVSRTVGLQAEQIAVLEKAMKVFQDDTVARKFHIEHLEGQIAMLTKQNKI